MSNIEIKNKIDNNNLKIRELMDKFDFTLNDKLNSLLEENDYIRIMCHHEFEDGICKWCGELEGK